MHKNVKGNGTVGAHQLRAYLLSFPLIYSLLLPPIFSLVPFSLAFPMAAPANKMRAPAFLVVVVMAFLSSGAALGRELKFGSKRGEFKILQVADMHFGDGKRTPCLDVLPRQVSSCSDLNTTAFIRRMILAERPDFIVFTGQLINSCCLRLIRREINLLKLK